MISAFKGELQELAKEHRGTVRLKIIDEKLKSIINSDALEVTEGHHIGIKILPKNFISCAYSNHGVEIVKHKNKPIVGFQFHPEISKNQKILKWAFETLNLKV